MSATKTEKLATEKISKLVLSFSLTTFAALIFNSIYTLTDALFVSWGVGDNAMGGVSVVFPFIILQSAIATAVGGGAASIVARMLGKGDKASAGDVTFNAMLTFYISAVIITILGFVFMEPLLKTMGVTNELYPLAKQYFTIILAGNVFSTGFSSIIRAEGKMTYALLIWVIPISVNILLDALFILVFNWGIRGSAAATVICQFFSFIMCVLFFTRFSVQSFKNVKLKLKRIGEILAIGLPSLVQMGSISIASVILNNILSTVGGTNGINSFAYISKIMTFAVVPFTAVAQALSPIVGFNYGAKNNERVKKTVSFCFILCFAYSVFATAAVRIFAGKLIGIFTDNGDLISQAENGLSIVAFSLVFTFIPILFGAAQQAKGKMYSAFLMYASMLIFLIPSAIIMSKLYGTNGVWRAYVVANAAACVFSLIVMFVLKKNDVARNKTVC